MFGNVQDLQVHNAYFSNVGRDQYNVTNILAPEDDKALMLLKPVPRSEASDAPRCIPGTRESVFREIDDWLGCKLSIYTMRS
jgi:hypothetical protein